MAQHNELGKQGEEAATQLLRAKKYRIRERNWSFRGYEVDIIAENNTYIIFVEVKSRTSLQWGNPEDFVDERRMRRMVKAANCYLIGKKIDKPARFDIVGALWNGREFDRVGQ